MKKILDIIKIKFQFLEKKFNYTKVDDIYGKNIGAEYKYAKIYYNDLLTQKLSVVYYDKNPVKKEETKEIAFQIIIFKNGNHLDFSRLLKSNTTFSKYYKYQYFILSYDDENQKIDIANNFLELISKEIFHNQYKIISGKDWIDIDYNLRDDY